LLGYGPRATFEDGSLTWSVLVTAEGVVDGILVFFLFDREGKGKMTS
jgi:hypothetical protein